MEGVEGASLALYSLRLYCQGDAELAEGVTIHIVDPSQDDSDLAILDQIAAHRPDLLGISCFLWTRERLMQLVRAHKSRYPDTITIAGGPDVGSVASRCLDAHPFLDAVCQWEGEEALRLLLRRMANIDSGEWQATPGFTVRTDGAHSVNPPAAIVDMAAIPSLQEDPDYLVRYPTLFVQTSRGCHYGCTFCLYNKTTRQVRSLDLIEQELTDWVARGRRQVEFIDAGLNQFPDRFRAILGYVADHPTLYQPFVEMNVEMLREDDVQLVAKTASRVAIGLQSASRQINKNVMRPYRQHRFRSKVKMLEDAGVEYSFDLIYGLPGDTFEQFELTMDEAYEMSPVLVAPFCLQILPGSTLEGQATDKWGMEWLPDPWYWLQHSETFPRAQLERAARMSQANDILHTFTFRSTAFQVTVHSLQVGASKLLAHFIDGDWRDKPISDDEISRWAHPDGLPELSAALRLWVDAVLTRFGSDQSHAAVTAAWELQLAMARVITRPLQAQPASKHPLLSPNAELLDEPPLIVVRTESGATHVPISRFIVEVLQRCDGQRSLDDVLEPWRDEAGPDWPTVRHDVAQALQTLGDMGMIGGVSRSQA